jgi:hypothetical protein
MLLFDGMQWGLGSWYTCSVNVLSAISLALQNVPETTHFAPHVRYEIGAFGWYHIDHLPATYDESKQARAA